MHCSIESSRNEHPPSELLSPDGSAIVLRLADQNIEVLPVSDADKAPIRLTPNFGYGLMTLTSNGRHLMVCSHRGDAEGWKISTLQATLRKLSLQQRYCNCATLSKDSRFLVAAHGDDQASFWTSSMPLHFHLTTKALPYAAKMKRASSHLIELGHPPTHRFEVSGEARGVFFLPAKCFAGTEARDTIIWPLDKKRTASLTLASVPSINGVAFSSHGRYAVQGSTGGLLRLGNFLKNS